MNPNDGGGVKRVAILLLAGVLAALGACAPGGANRPAGGDADDDGGGYSPSFHFGVTDFNYYGDLGGYTGATFYADQAWAASHVDFAISGQGDAPMQQTWQAIAADRPTGKWLPWRPPHLFYTYDATGTCANPQVGARDAQWSQNEALFAQFLAARPEYGDGESCFLHARRDGRIQATWQGQGCNVILQQKGLDDSANGVLADARLSTIVWSGWTWLFNLASSCAVDYNAWRAIQCLQQGFGGEGYDNLGSPVEDGFSLPLEIDPIDIIEIPAASQATTADLDAWWFAGVASFLRGVRDQTRAVAPAATFVFNGAAYCSWNGSTAQLAALAGDGIGVWCENALQDPCWGPLGTADRLAALRAFSATLAAENSFLALETFYDDGDVNPTPASVMFYLAAFYALKNDADVLALRPSWSPYSPLMDTCWFDVFGRDLGSPTGPAEETANGVFARGYRRNDGQTALVVVRADGGNPSSTYPLDGSYLRIDADNRATAVSGALTLDSGDGLILIRQ